MSDSIKNGCPVCDGELKAYGDHENYKSYCIKNCYVEQFRRGRYAISVFDKYFHFEEDKYNEYYEQVTKEIGYWKTYYRYIAKWLEEPEDQKLGFTVQEIIGMAFISQKAVHHFKGEI